jgi:hypothetical protein
LTGSARSEIDAWPRHHEERCLPLLETIQQELFNESLILLA